MIGVYFTADAFKEFNNWAISDIKVYNKIVELIKNIQREPFIGIGKPEPLKNKLKGYWSRRITDIHRLVYKFENETIYIISCQNHYDGIKNL